MVGVVLHLEAEGQIIGETETDSEGIYAFDYLDSNTAYTVNAVLRGYGFNSQKITTGISQDNSIVSGNVWGVDFAGLFCDFNGDQKVDVEDMTILIEHWDQADPAFDIAPAPLGDGTVDFQDLEVLMDYWGEEVPEPGLVAHWKLDEIEGNITYGSVYDRSGTLYGSPNWQPTGGKLQGALQFDGVDDYISTDFVLNPANGAFSVFSWVKSGAPGGVIVSQTNGTGSGETWLGTEPSSGKLLSGLVPPPVGRFVTQPLKSEFITTDDQWHHVGFVWDGSYRHLYVDGTEVAKDAVAVAALKSATGGLYIGAGKTLDAASFFSGLIDDVRIYDRAVTP
jgi:hypothetical protein